jgi:hypothetical protein
MRRGDVVRSVRKASISDQGNERLPSKGSCRDDVTPLMEKPFQHFTVSFPSPYTEEDANRLKAEFPGIRTILNARGFAIEESAGGRCAVRKAEGSVRLG